MIVCCWFPRIRLRDTPILGITQKRAKLMTWCICWPVIFILCALLCTLFQIIFRHYWTQYAANAYQKMVLNYRERLCSRPKIETHRRTSTSKLPTNFKPWRRKRELGNRSIVFEAPNLVLSFFGYLPLSTYSIRHKLIEQNIYEWIPTWETNPRKSELSQTSRFQKGCHSSFFTR